MTNNFLSALDKLMTRDLEKLEQEIAAYPRADSIWTLRGEIKNTAGNLCLHLCGNLQHFIGTVLANSGYKRDREREFAARNVATDELLSEIRRTRKIVHDTLPALDPSLLDKEYPIQVFGEPMSTAYFLMHLAGHLNYHLGQINYHRRIVAA